MGNASQGVGSNAPVSRALPEAKKWASIEGRSAHFVRAQQTLTNLELLAGTEIGSEKKFRSMSKKRAPCARATYL